MGDENNQPNDNPKTGLRLFLKVIGLTLVIILAIVVVGFGLLVGFCALASRRH
jgi:hypothetical protein